MSDTTYEPKPSLKYATTVGLQAGVVGAFVSAIQNALGTHSHGALGVVTRTGGTIGFFGLSRSSLHVVRDSRFDNPSRHGRYIRAH